MNIYRYNRCIYSLVSFYMVCMVRSGAPSLIYSIYISVPVPDRIGYSVFSEQSRLEEFNHNQSINQWRRIASGIASFTVIDFYIYIYFWLLLCVSFCVLCNSCVVCCVFIIYTNSLFCVLFCLLFVRYLLQGAARFDISLRYKIDLILT